MNDRKSFAFMVDWIPVLELLDTKEEYDEVLEAIRSTLNDEIPIVKHPKAMKAWEFIEPKLRENTKKYEEAKEKRIEALKRYNERKKSGQGNVNDA